MDKTSSDNVLVHTNGTEESYDREKELKAFEESKLGVKGFIDSNAKTVPKMFIVPQEELSKDLNTPCVKLKVPIIDLADVGESGCYDAIVKQVLSAAGEWGFLRVVNHGIPLEVLDNLLLGIRKQNEQDVEIKKKYYSVPYNLYQSKAVDWRDSFSVGHDLDPNEIPEICRDAILDYLKHALKLAETLLELFSMALGLKPSYLKEKTGCHKAWNLFNHYYPACPAPEITVGNTKHSDPVFFTILLQDHIGGLQVLHQNQWVDVEPIRGALVINIGDFFQMMSNDKFRSVYHRVTTNRVGPRISSALFFAAIESSKSYGPIKELLSEEHPPLYRDFTYNEFYAHFYTRSIDEPGCNYWKINNDAE